MRARLIAGLVAAGSSAALMRWGRQRETISGLHWHRRNHAGQTVTLWEGAAYAKGVAIGGLTAGSWPVVTASLGSAVFGALDDHHGDSSSKGLRGHLGALASGEVTTGAVKILGIGLTGLATAVLVDRGAGRPLTASTLIGAGVIAGAANVCNLLDLRPGRALKATMIAGAPLLFGRSGVASATAIGAAAGVIMPDLRGESMLGDTGANAAGAVIGTAAVQCLGWRGRLLALGGLTALTLASERVSFTSIIETTPALKRIDDWGRPR